VARGAAIAMRLSLDERASVSADLFRYRPGGRRVFSGFETWHGHVGYNRVGLAAVGRHFHARPSRYLAVVRATDASANESRPKRVRLRILPRRR